MKFNFFLRNKWIRSVWAGWSAEVRIQVLVQTLLLVVMGSVQWSIYLHQQESAVESFERTAVDVSDGIINGLNVMMHSGIISQPEMRQLFVKKMGATEGILSLQVLRGKPVQNQFGPGLEEEQPTDELDNRVLNEGHRISQRYTEGDKSVLRVLIPFIAKEEFRGTNCLSCHQVAAGTVNGAMDLRLDITEELAAIENYGLKTVAEFVVLQLLLVFVIRWLLRSNMRSILNVRDSLKRMVETGNLSTRVEIDSTDSPEARSIGISFNELIDMAEASFRESATVALAIAKNSFYRSPLTAGLRGTALQSIKASAESFKALRQQTEALEGIMKALAAGNFEKRMPPEIQTDFAKSVNLAMESMQIMLDEVGQVMNDMAQGNLTGRVKAEGRGDLEKLKQSVNSSLEGLSRLLQSINDNTRQVATAANESSHAIGQIADGAQNQMHAISQVATAVRETATSVADVSSNTEMASQKSQESVAIVRDGKIKMERMIDVVNSIAANSEKINKITEVIEGIANKTNLLSLNAAIEAARAGEHGRGFAVVAEEVGKLAANSASSTQEIATLVQQAVADASRAVQTVREVAYDMERIEKGSVDANGMMQRISAALEQQSAAVHEINASVTSLNKIAQSNAAASEEITATVVELAKIAENTRREVDKFKV